MVLSALASTIGAAAAALTCSSIYNVLEMYNAVNQHHELLLKLDPSTKSHQTSKTSRLSSSSKTSFLYEMKEWESIDQGLSDLKRMSRRDLIQLYLQCESFHKKKVFDCITEYDGYLLDNGPILTPVTNFITHKLFGFGQTWIGKVYFPMRDKEVHDTTIGMNRFISKSGKERWGRSFDYSIGSSAIAPPPLPLSSLSSTHPERTVLIHDYSKHGPKGRKKSISSFLWSGMVDELRVIPIEILYGKRRRRKDEILLGMGYFDWSGGIWNSAPFCLVRRSSDAR